MSVATRLESHPGRPSSSPISYPECGNETYFAVEDSSFWFRHRNAVIVEAVRRRPPAGAIYDIGGGNGFVAQGLEAAGFRTVLIEPGASGAANARRRGLTNVICATVETAGLPRQSLTAAGMFDVLEHIEDDNGFLQLLADYLIPGALFYLTVPAHRWLWAHDDVCAGHFRRYSQASLKKVLERNGFELEYASYFFSFLPLPIFLVRSAPSWLGIRRDPGADSTTREHANRQGMAGRLVDSVMAWEQRRIGSGKRIFVGSSCLAVARRL